MGNVIHDQSQEDRIAALLRERGDWVSAVELSAISLQYCRAVSGLRKRGMKIENEVRMKGKIRHGYYRLARAVAVQVPLIPDMGMQHWRDPEERI
ncbi:MAG TPA: hypothetical protein VNY51_09430 [Candidatus Dormibacteraeota bacterium]|jgi:hypothetical protein|nr:hypothetical protein [Candidatus Dormibacteraeota bacterium]